MTPKQKLAALRNIIYLMQLNELTATHIEIIFLMAEANPQKKVESIMANRLGGVTVPNHFRDIYNLMDKNKLPNQQVDRNISGIYKYFEMLAI